MMLHALIPLLSLVYLAGTQSTATITEVAAASCTAVNPTWAAWGAWGTCSDTCGSCGIQTRQRSCNSTVSACPCSGISSDSQVCGTLPCKNPRVPCCTGMRLTTAADGNFTCAATGRK